MHWLRTSGYFLTTTITLHSFIQSSAFQTAPQALALVGLSHHAIQGRLGTSLLPMASSIDLNDVELRALEASESWSVAVTSFLNEADAALVETRLGNRADVGYVRVGGLPSSSRTRFVMTNPDLGLDAATAEAEHCTILCIDNINSAIMRSSSPWPHVLTKIGINIDDVGDVVVEDGNAYMVVAPEVTKQCSRLLPKELKGVGITISSLQPGEYLPCDGVLQDMELGKLDKRALKYK